MNNKPTAMNLVEASVAINVLRARQRATRKQSLAAHAILGAVALIAIAGCSSTESDHGGEQVKSVRQNITLDPGAFDAAASTGVTAFTDPFLGPGIQLVPGGKAVFSVALPTDDHYSIHYNVRRTGATSNVALHLVSPDLATEYGMSDVPIRTQDNGTGDIDVTHAAIISDPASVGSVALTVTGEAIEIYSIVIAPLRTGDTADPATVSFVAAGACAGCHNEQFQQWQSSMMGYSSISPPIHALELTENHVQRDPTTSPYGRLARTRSPLAPLTAVHGEGQLFCQRCHAPVAVFTDVFRAFDDFGFSDTNRGTFPDSHSLLRQLIGADSLQTALLRSGDFDANAATPNTTYQGAPDSAQIEADALAATEGVTCSVCHSINGIDERVAPGTPSRPTFKPGEANAAYRVVHNGPGETRINFGPYGDDFVAAAHPAGQMAKNSNVMLTGTDGVNRPFIETGELCGTCHDVRIPSTDATTGEAFRRVENLFTEWHDSPWNNNGIPYNPATSGGVFENPGAVVDPATGLKASTSCQDCHMSKFVTHDKALPGEYEMGFVSDDTTLPMRKRSNHRFMGVDRFLTYDKPVATTPPAVDMNTTELQHYDIALGSANLLDPADSRTFNADFPAANDNRDLREILLQKAVDFKIEHIGPVVNNQFPVSISVENVGAGHHIPAGLSEERQVWIELEVQAKDGRNVFTTGYLNDPGHQFVATNPTRYSGSYCGATAGVNEPHCDLDLFHASLGPFLNILPDDSALSVGPDLQLKNYENGFTKNSNKVFTQFIADSVINTMSLAPFKKDTVQYTVPVGQLDPALRSGPFTVNARLRFRPFPLEFLETLKSAFPAGRITDAQIERNKVIEMEEDHCVAGTYGLIGTRPCNRDAVVPLSLGDASTCAVFGSGQANLSGSTQCFGTNSNGEAGIGVGPTAVASPSVLTLLDVTMTSLGVSHGCGLLRDGTVSCWGDGTGGKLADNSTAAHKRTAPRQIAATLNDVTAIASGGYTTCALSRGSQPADATVSCWGQSTSGELGDNNVAAHNRGVPNQISPSTLVGVEAIAGGLHHYCAIAQSGSGVPGSVRCWGQAKGTGQGSNVAVPTDVGGLAYRTKKLAAGENFTCALLASGEVNCWGDNTFGALGNSGAGAQSLTPVKVTLPERATDIVAGRNHACALLSQTNSVMCWGRGLGGRLGNGDIADVNHSDPIHVVVPGGVPGSTPFDGVAFIAAGGDHTCAITEAGTRYCWGRNNVGQLGVGHTTDEPTPQPISFADPTITGRTYYAPASEGGSGTSGPFTTGCTTSNCTDQTTYIDLNEGAGYRFMIQSDGGPTNLFPRIGVPSGTRTMAFYVDGAFVQNITSSSTLTPRPQGAEVGLATRNFTPGYHSVEFRDINAQSQNQEFDILDLRVAGLAGASCFDVVQNQNETGVDCGGVCRACGVGVGCQFNSDCLSNVCDGTGHCAAPPPTPPSSSPCASFCTNPQVVQVNGDYQSHELGTGTICRETTSPVVGGNCGNFANGRTLTVNGVTEPCNNQNWPSLPAKVNGGYCVQATAGLQSYAYFVLFE